MCFRSNVILRNIALAILIAISLIGCVSAYGPKPEAKLLYTQEEEQIIRSWSTEELYKNHVYWMKHHRPAGYGFEEELARRGYRIVPYLKEQLEKEKNELLQRSLIRIFYSMTINGVDLRENEELISLLHQRTSNISDWELFSNSLNTIFEGPPTDNE